MTKRTPRSPDTPRQRSTVGLLLSGMATLTFYHRMSISRRRLSQGSLEGDWRAISGDLQRALRRMESARGGS